MPESFHPGRLAKLYYNSGTYALPTWVEIKRVTDVNTPMTKNTSQVVTRESPNQKTIIGSKTFQITGTYVEKVATDTVLAAIKASFFADSAGATDAELDLAAMNQAIATSGSTGIRGFFVCTQLDRAEPIGDAVTRSLTFDEVDHEESSAVVDVDEYTTA